MLRRCQDGIKEYRLVVGERVGEGVGEVGILKPDIFKRGRYDFNSEKHLQLPITLTPTPFTLLPLCLSTSHPASYNLPPTLPTFLSPVHPLPPYPLLFERRLG
jgi:hypothetical protein